jgi:phage shock protein E
VRGIEGPGEVGENPSPQGAVNATWDTLNMGFVDPAKLPADKNAPVVVFWQKGGRASKAKAFLEQQGYSDVHNAGGVDRVKRMFDK